MRTKALLMCVASLALAALTAPAGAAAPHATCRSSSAAFALPFTGRTSKDFAQLTTTRGGRWAGVAYSNRSHTIYLVSWQPHRQATVLARFGYQGAYEAQLSVVPAGITTDGAVVAAVQRDSSSGEFLGGRFVGTYWVGGKAHDLAHSSTWWGWTPTAVTDAGRIVGYAATGSHTRPVYYAVTWASVRSAPVTLARLGTAVPTVTATGEGDLLWTRTDGYSMVKLRTGSVKTLTTSPSASGPGYVFPSAAGRTTVFAEGPDGLLRWDLAPGTPDRPSVVGTGPGPGNWALTAGSRGDLVIDVTRPGRVRLASGATATLPAAPTDLFSGRAIDEHGTVAYTAARDRLVHLTVCR